MGFSIIKNWSAVAALAVLVLIFSLRSSSAQNLPAGASPSFSYEFSGVEDKEVCSAGATVSATVECILLSRGDAPDGARAFSFGVIAEGGTITGISTEGGEAVRLLDGGYEITEIIDGSWEEVACEEGPCPPVMVRPGGAICGMILSFEQNITLPPNGTVTLATLSIETTVGNSFPCLEWEAELVETRSALEDEQANLAGLRGRLDAETAAGESLEAQIITVREQLYNDCSLEFGELQPGREIAAPRGFFGLEADATASIAAINNIFSWPCWNDLVENVGGEGVFDIPESIARGVLDLNSLSGCADLLGGRDMAERELARRTTLLDSGEAALAAHLAERERVLVALNRANEMVLERGGASLPANILAGGGGDLLGGGGIVPGVSLGLVMATNNRTTYRIRYNELLAQTPGFEATRNSRANDVAAAQRRIDEFDVALAQAGCEGFVLPNPCDECLVLSETYGDMVRDLEGLPARLVEIEALIAGSATEIDALGAAVDAVTQRVQWCPLQAWEARRAELEALIRESEDEDDRAELQRRLVAIPRANEVVLSYRDGLEGDARPVRNTVTWRGESYVPALETASYSLRVDPLALSGPSAPGGLAAVAGDTSVTLEWDESDGAATYTVRRDGEVVAEELAETAYVDHDVDNGATYSYTVSASNRCREGEHSASVEATFGETGVGPFSRGDANSDGAFDISDGIFVLGYLFLGNANPGCLAAADSNKDGGVNIADPTYTLIFLFGGGAGFPGPNACGLSTDEGDVAQGCETPACN